MLPFRVTLKKPEEMGQQEPHEVEVQNLAPGQEQAQEPARTGGQS